MLFIYSLDLQIVLLELPHTVVALSDMVYWTSSGTRTDKLVIAVSLTRTIPPLLFDIVSEYCCTSAHVLS